MQVQTLTSQAFVPYGDVFAVPTANGRRDASLFPARTEAFLAGPGQGVTCGPDAWHHPMAVFDAPARFAVLVWRDGGADGEAFVDVTPFTLDLR